MHDEHRTPARIDGLGHPIFGSLDSPGWPADSRLARVFGGDGEYTPWPKWADHQFTEPFRDGENAYVCHPYRLSASAYVDFIRLELAGFHVSVTGKSIYYPGSTVRVTIY